MRIGAIDPKVPSGLIFRYDLGTHTRVVGLQTAILEFWPVLSDGCIESLAPHRIDRIIDLILRLNLEPLHIGTKLSLTRHIKG